MAQRTLYTVGHSTRTWSQFIELLKAWMIEDLVDVRTLPRSRTFPWFTKHRMAQALPKAGIAYAHIAALGGLRKPHGISVNTGWRNARFRAYADAMQAAEFEAGLVQLNQRREKRRVCVMCSEAVWWRCHRRMIADAETARGIPVRHIMSATTATRHELTVFAVVSRRRGHAPVLTYQGDAMAKKASRTKGKAKSFAVGDHVAWNSEAGRVRGTITKVHTKDFDYKGHTHRASVDEPQYEIKSDKTDHVAAHKGSTLRKVPKSLGRSKR